VSYRALAKLAGASDFLALAIATRAPAKTPYLCHCERRPRGGDIHRLAAETVLHSLPSSLPDRPLLVRPGDQKRVSNFGESSLKTFHQVFSNQTVADMQHLEPYVVEAIFHQLRVDVSGIAAKRRQAVGLPEPKAMNLIGQAAAVGRAAAGRRRAGIFDHSRAGLSRPRARGARRERPLVRPPA
jgi:hypothetical protein